MFCRNVKDREWKLACLAGICLVVGLAGCGKDDGGGGASGEFLEAPPSQKEVDERLADLRGETEGVVDAQLREQVEEHIDGPGGSSPWPDAVHFPIEEPDDGYRMAAAAAFLDQQEQLALWLWVRAAQEKPEGNLSQVAFGLNKQERFDESIALSLAAVDKRPDDFVPLRNLAFAYEQQGQMERASYYQARVVSLSPRNPWSKVALGDMLAQRGYRNAAGSLYKIAAIRAPDDDEIAARVEALSGTDATETMDGQLRASEADILDALEARDTAVEQEYEAQVEQVLRAYQSIIDSREIDKDVNLGEWVDCNSQCAPGEDACEADCMKALCETESGQHGPYAAALSSNAADFDAVRMDEAAAFLRAIAEVRRDFPGADETELMYFEMLADGGVFERTGSIDSHHVMVKSVIGSNKTYVEQACTAAEYLEQLAAAKEAMANQQSPYDVCLDGVLCIGVDGDRFTIGVQVGFVAADLAISPASGDFTLGLGVGITDPTGTIDVSVGLKYDSVRGGGIGGDFKFGGPVKLKYSRDIYFTNE
ncbi:MAG: tetratricopeptide repeat protein [Myxococcota bacterium]